MYFSIFKKVFNRILFSLFSGILLLTYSNAWSQSEPVNGKVVDEKGMAVPRAEVIVDNNPTVTTDAAGKFSLIPAKTLEMPFDVAVKKEGYKVQKFYFMDNKMELEVIVRTVSTIVAVKEVLVKVFDENSMPVSNAIIKVNTKDYTTDKNGAFNAPINFSEGAKVQLKGYLVLNIQYEKGPKEYTINVKIDKPKEIAVVQPPVQIITKSDLKSSAFTVYQNYFKKLFKELQEEKRRIELINQKIQAELDGIMNQLRNEKNLTAAQKRQLHQYAHRLESNIADNAVAYQNSVSRTNTLIGTMRKIIIEKDSITIEAQRKVAIAQKTKIAAEQKLHRNFVIFSIIVGTSIVFITLVTLALLKINKQKKKLQAANDEISLIKNQLASNVQELKESNEQLEIFVYKASHDIKGPLRSIIGLTKIGQEDVKDPAALNYFDHILQSTKKLDKLLLDLLEVTKVKQATITPESINFQQLVSEALESFKHLPGYELMTFDIKIKEKGTFKTDKKLMYSIIQNLIENPIKYLDPEKPEHYLQIEINADDHKANLAFKDNGLGIPTEHQNKVFEMFYKTNEKSNGTGLGLYIVKTSVEKLKSKIRLESALRVGSTFYVDMV